MMEQISLIVVGSFLSCLLTIIVWYLREIRAGFKNDQDRQDRAILKIEQKLDEMPEKYVFRDDFVRWSITIDKKIDDLKGDMKCLLEMREEAKCRQSPTRK